MGIWAFPGTAEKASELASLLAAPLPAQSASQAVIDLVGEDNLHAALEDWASDNPEADVRGVVAETAALMAASVIDPEAFTAEIGTWMKPWDDGIAEQVLDNAIAAMEETGFAPSYPLAQWLDARSGGPKFR